VVILAVNFYIEHLRVETKMFCKEIQEANSGQGLKLDLAIKLAKDNGYTIDLTYKSNTHALIYKFYSHPGICIGYYKDGILHDVKYIYHI